MNRSTCTVGATCVPPISSRSQCGVKGDARAATRHPAAKKKMALEVCGVAAFFGPNELSSILEEFPSSRFSEAVVSPC